VARPRQAKKVDASLSPQKVESRHSSAEKQRKPKKVIVVDEKDKESVHSRFSTTPLVGELDQSSPAAKPAAHSNQTPSSNEQTQASSPEARKAKADDLSFQNRRHNKEFQKLKSSDAMSTLLKADEQVEKKRRIVSRTRP
jgi:hypothetical protein